MSSVGVLARHGLVLVRREPGPSISRLVSPIIVITLLEPLYSAASTGAGNGGAGQAVGAGLVLFSLLGMSVVAGMLLTERLWGTLDRLRATPASPLAILTGKSLPAFGLVLAQQMIIIGYGVTVLDLRIGHPGLLAAGLFAWSVALLALGAAIGAAVRSPGQLTAVIDMGSITLTAFSGALIPLAQLPAWAATIAPVSPGYWAIRAVTGAAREDATAVWTSVAVLLGIAALAATAAAALLAAGWRRDRPS